MIRSLLLAVFLTAFFFTSSISQITISSDNFPVGGLNVGRGYAFGSNANLGTTGGPQFFDFTGIVPLYHDSINYYDALLTPWTSFHPGASVCNAESANNVTYVYYYTSDANTFRKTGLTVIGDFGAGLDTVHGNYLPSDTLLSTDYSFNHGESEYSSATILNLVPFANYKTCSFRDVFVDAWGSLQTPLNYYPNVLRVIYAEYRFDTITYLGSPIYTSMDSLFSYKYYAEDVRYPVVTAHTDNAYNLQYLEFIFTPPVILGCMDSLAQNYNPLANQSDGSCEYCNINYTITPDTIVCQGSMVALNVSGGNSYLWSDGSTSSSISVIPDQTTVYSVYISTIPTCHALATVTVTVDEPVMASFWTTHHSYNTGEEIQFVNLSENATSFFWTFDDPADDNSNIEFPVHTYTTAGDKQVVLIAGNSCYSDTISDTLTIISLASIETSNLSELFRIYPNPGKDALFVEGVADQEGIMSIYAADMLGRNYLLSKEVVSAGAFRIKADVNHLPPGLYLLEMISENSSMKMKWIKM